MPTVPQLEQAFRVYFDEIERCRSNGCYWALLHVVVSLPDICAALESENNWATEKKYVGWCDNHLPNPGLSAEDYREVRNLVLHQGQTLSRSGRYYKFTSKAGPAHRTKYDEIMILGVDELTTEMLVGIRKWFVALQKQGAAEFKANVAKNLPTLVTVKEQRLPGSVTETMFGFTHTTTDPPRFNKPI